MDKVYLLMVGEFYDGERVSGVFRSMAGAMAGLEALVAEEKEDGVEFEQYLGADAEGPEWRAGGCYIRVVEHEVR